jgi:RNA polymerase sigma-70 factor (ECF subfamily)
MPLHGGPPRAEALSDTALVAACAVGDSAALGCLFDRYHPRVYRLVSRLVGSSTSEVDDLVQATFLEVWKGAARFRGESTALTWILGISANLSRRYARTESRRAAATDALAARPLPAGADVAAAVERRQLVSRMASALSELPHALREAFVLCDVEELSGVEAARVLEVRPGTLWRRLHEARMALREALGAGGRP